MFLLQHRRIVLIILALNLISSPANGGLERSRNEAAALRPNIILILADDLDKNAINAMPNLRLHMIDQGVTFKNYFVNVPNCCPSRASLLRGQHAHNHGILNNSPPYGGFQRFRDLGLEKSTVATWLKQAGYRTVLMGKYMNGYGTGQVGHVPPGWDEWYSIVSGTFFRYQLNENRRLVSYGNSPEEYETDVYTRKAIDFIHRTAKQSPFFIYVAPIAPHTPAIPAPRHSTAFSGVIAPRVPSFNEADLSDKPKKIQKLPLLNSVQIASIDQLYRSRLRTMLAVDDLVGEIVEALEQTGQLENTYIFFTSDNGFHQGEHRIQIGKNTPYDEATNVPLIVRGPTISKACIGKRFIQNIDLAPTFAEIAGVRPPAFVDGRSIIPLFINDKTRLKSWRTDALIEHWVNNAPKNSPNFLAIRNAQYLYIEHRFGERELYEVENDPFQVNSIHDTADQDLIEQLARKLRALTGSIRTRSIRSHR